MRFETDSKKVPVRSFSKAIWIFFCGLCMGSMDVIPGISGGTVAFIMGIYEDLISAIRSVKFHALKNISWEFLLCLLSGISIAFLSLAHVFDRLLKDADMRVALYSAFMGLILGSILYLTRQMKRWRGIDYLALLIGAAIAFVLTLPELAHLQFEPRFDVKIDLPYPAANYQDGHLLNISRSNLEGMLAKGWINENTPLLLNGNPTSIAEQGITAAYARFDLWAMFCGMIAISAMLLPGISGSYLMNILGMYGPAIAALADLGHSIRSLSFNLDAFMLLFSIACGILIGALLFSRVIGWLLTRYHALAIALLTGFMIGAIRSVWPFWSHVQAYNPLKLNEPPSLSVVAPILPPLDSTLLSSLLFMLAGLSVLLIFEWIAHKKHLIHKD